MEGVTILAEEAVRDFHFLGFIGMTLVVALGLLFITLVVFEPDTIIGTSVVIFFSVVIGLGAGFVTGRFANDPVSQYKVLVSEEVSIIEFYEKYEIIDREDLIFTVREKNQN